MILFLDYVRIFKRYVDVPEGAKEMVAGPNHYCTAVTWCITHFWKQQRRCPIYLFFVLI